MSEPSTYYPWAINDLTHDITVDGVEYQDAPNKTEPAPELKNRGIMYNDPMPIQYWNYISNGIYLWFRHLDQRYAVGDIFETIANYSQSLVNEKLGGTWFLLGQKTGPGGLVYYWRKSA